MIFKNAMSFKQKMRQISSEKGLTPQQVQQQYLIEAFLVKLAASNYTQNFIVKGGYLIGGLVGINRRATMDLDTTVKGFPLNPPTLQKIAREIVEIPTNESFAFSVSGVESIRETDDYPGLRLKLEASFERIQETVLIDVTTGDVITPQAVIFHFHQMFGDEKIKLFSYPVETILAEKIETILSRGIATTRPRDFYDVFILSKLKNDQIDFVVLKQAFENTLSKRQVTFAMTDYRRILQEISESAFQQELWLKYQKLYSYAKEITFAETIDEIKQIIQQIVSITT